MTENETRPTDFIRSAIEEDIKSSRFGGKVHTRFPPEPNGYLHIGHAKAICINYGIAEEYASPYNLRFDDTNPTREETEYVDAIMEDIRWLTIKQVFCCTKLLKFDIIFSSVSVSTADKQSSNKSIVGFLISALAIDTRCFCPPDKVIPRSPKRVL